MKKEKFNLVYNEEFAYFLGWMYSDGCITSDKRCNSKTVKIKIIKEDSEVFKLFNRIASWHTNLEGKYIRLHKTSTIFGDKLIELGVLPRKSYENKNNLHFPKNIPESLIPYFIRGFFDGDGTYMWNNKVTNSLYGECVSTSYTLMKEMSDYLTKHNIHHQLYEEDRSNRKRSKQNVYKIRIRSKEGMINFVNLIFNYKLNIGLKRKIDIIKTFKSKLKSCPQ